MISEMLKRLSRTGSSSSTSARSRTVNLGFSTKIRTTSKACCRSRKTGKPRRSTKSKRKARLSCSTSISLSKAQHGDGDLITTCYFHVSKYGGHSAQLIQVERRFEEPPSLVPDSRCIQLHEEYYFIISSRMVKQSCYSSSAQKSLHFNDTC